VDEFDACTRFETPVMWNVEGPPGPVGPEGPQGPQGEPGISLEQVAALEQEILDLQNLVQSLQTQVAALGAVDVAELENDIDQIQLTLSCVSYDPVGHDFIIDGCNVHVRDGTGATASTTGLGNLIIGYNESRGVGSDRTGSHNLVVGQQQNYNRYGGLVAGFANNISGPYATVSGGRNNTASGDIASVSGGFGHAITGIYDWQAGSLFETQLRKRGIK